MEHEGDGYWIPRSGYRYYQTVRRWLNQFHYGGSILDVGGHDTPVAAWGDFDRRTIVTQKDVANRLPHVEYNIMDFMDFDPDRKFDVVTCLQVLEHLEQVDRFAEKLLSHAKVALIVSVPHKWDSDANEAHPQDPVDIVKLSSWFGREPDEQVVFIEEGGVERLVVMFYIHSLQGIYT